MDIRLQPAFRLSPFLNMQFMEPLGNADSSVDAAWSFLENRWRPAAVELFRSLECKMLRWGGCFASYYHWKEAVGPRDKRVPMLNLCWDGVFSNQIGTEEYLELCRLMGAEPFICVNTASDGRTSWAHPLPGMDRCGTPEEAAEWVAYCNAPDNPLRRANGHAAPHSVKYWQLGNETSYRFREPLGEHKLAHSDIPADEFAQIEKQFAQAMRAVDPNLVLLGWGDNDWHKPLCEVCGDLIDLVAFHYHFAYSPEKEGGAICGVEYRKDWSKTWDIMMGTCRALDEKLQAMEAAVAPYGKKLAMTEGHYAIQGRNRGDVLASWTAGVAYARNLNTIARHGNSLEIATSADFCGNRWQVNAVILPTPDRGSRPYLMPVGTVMALFGKHVGEHAIPVECATADVTASMTGNKVFLHIVNPSPASSVQLPLNVVEREIASATAWEIAADPSDEIMPYEPDKFAPHERTIDPGAYTLPPAGVAALELTLK
ncbi:MAG: hypothetical protein IJJ26_07580 [Victivallales bacterium]|nr:hypothetical protein [Victivallales bacterium]